MSDRNREATRVIEATRIARDVRVGTRSHRVEMVLENNNRGGRYYVDAIPTSAGDFDRMLRLVALVETGTHER